MTDQLLINGTGSNLWHCPKLWRQKVIQFASCKGDIARPPVMETSNQICTLPLNSSFLCPDEELYPTVHNVKFSSACQQLYLIVGFFVMEIEKKF
ncbi:hypothetical protein TNIN_382571 [Trichonephila inaurata madagascariensis]|uniref:Uncharacterized protein n=1 Tax=Trichonephila inaurata madagascariensis TaxID=2747483 RepID=A0A8X6WME0_9ARAC|nr:hypothetical protein TNIN_382571 [Trichonephila inaurata madagascariensis]